MTTPLLRRRPLCPDLSLPADLHPVLAPVYAARVQDASALSLTWEALPSFSCLTDFKKPRNDLLWRLPRVSMSLSRAITTAVLVGTIGSFRGKASF
ncbi:MAG: hypothetical protein ACYDEV_16885 [Acidiferrobacter sp.]